MYFSNFQSYIFGSFLIFMMCFVACKNTPTEPIPLAFGVPTNLNVKQFTYYGANIKNGLKVVVEQINDSRCPTNAVCIWAGEVTVKLNISSLLDSTQVGLKITPAKNSTPDTLDFHLNQKTYQAILYSVNPYPNTSNPQDSLKAKITVLHK